jgi:hypothetical protein
MEQRTVAISEIGPTVYEQGKQPTVNGRPLEDVRSEVSAAAQQAEVAQADESANAEGGAQPVDEGNQSEADASGGAEPVESPAPKKRAAARKSAAKAKK